MPTAPKSSAYLPQLDGLRGLAILSVMVHHYDLPLPKWLDWGPIGVNLFFILSGYFITLSLWKTVRNSEATGQSRWSAIGVFQLRRLLRIVPVFWVFLGIALVMGIPEVRKQLYWHLLFLTNFHIASLGRWPDSVSHFWSLAVQEQFYIFWPLVILFCRGRWFIAALAACVVAAMAYRFGCLACGAPIMTRWVMLPGSLDAFAAGGMLAWISVNRPSLLNGRAAVAALGIFAVACFCYARWLRLGPEDALEVAWIDLLEVIFLAWVVKRTVEGWGAWTKSLFEFRALVYIGRISFGVYVYHVLVRSLVKPMLNFPAMDVLLLGLIQFVVMTGVTVCVATLSWRYIETPIAKWRALLSRKHDRISPIPAGPLTTT